MGGRVHGERRARGAVAMIIDLAAVPNAGQWMPPLDLPCPPYWIFQRNIPANLPPTPKRLGVDGMIVLHIDDEDLENDLMISSGIERKKFWLQPKG